jgi:hypothetical protein
VWRAWLRIISYHIISYHIISYHIISYHIISYHIISYHIIRLPAAPSGYGGYGGGGGGGSGEPGLPRSWAELSQEEQGKLIKERLKKYCQRVRRYGKGEWHGGVWQGWLKVG